MEDLRIIFSVDKIPFYAFSCNNQTKSIEITTDKDKLYCSVMYNSHADPLMLSGIVNLNDTVSVVLMKHRIELYVNEKLVDEEWPIGNRLFKQNDKLESTSQIQVQPYYPQNQKTPNVMGTFVNAEGWKPDDNVFVGDCMPYVRGDEYHVLYLKDRHHHYSKWGMGAHQWAHISTKDFVQWSVHPMAVEITDPSEGSICTGSWIQHNNLEYLYYTVRRGGTLAAPIKRSVSKDGYHFKKDESFNFVLPERYNRAVARDPKIVKGEDGLFHMIITTALMPEKVGCLAHFVSTDLENWQDTKQHVYISEDCTEPECPDYIVYNGRYYLIFSLNGKARYMFSDIPFGGWKTPKNPNIPCASVPKGAVWNNKIIFTGFNGIDGYAGTMTFKTATADENGELVFS